MLYFAFPSNKYMFKLLTETLEEGIKNAESRQ